MRGGVRSEGRREESFISQLTSPGTSAKNSRNGRCTFTANEKTLSSSTNQSLVSIPKLEVFIEHILRAVMNVYRPAVHAATIDVTSLPMRTKQACRAAIAYTVFVYGHIQGVGVTAYCNESPIGDCRTNYFPYVLRFDPYVPVRTLTRRYVVGHD